MVSAVLLPQSGSGRQTFVVEEQIVGQTPTGVQWERLRNTGGDGTTSETTTVESNELPGEVLGLRDLVRTGERGLISYTFELSQNTVYEQFFESLLMGEFGTTAPDELLPGDTIKTFTVEDWLPSVRSSESVTAAQITSMELTLTAQQIVTGTFTGSGASTAVNSRTVIASAAAADITFAVGVPGTIDVTTFAIPANTAVGDYILVNGFTQAADNDINGYYRISGLPGGSIIEIEGEFPNAGASTGVATETITFIGGAVAPIDTGGVDPIETDTPMRCGNQVDVRINDKDVLEYGLRIPEMTFTIENTAEDLIEITEDAPYASINVDRVITMSIQYHVINLEPINFLRQDEEFSLSVKIADLDGQSYEFTFPRCKSATANKGPAAKGEVMVGTWEVQALLDSTNINVGVQRVLVP